MKETPKAEDEWQQKEAEERSDEKENKEDELRRKV